MSDEKRTTEITEEDTVAPETLENLSNNKGDEE